LIGGRCVEMHCHESPWFSETQADPVVDRKTLEVAGAIAGQGMLGGGHQIATESKGNIYVAATGNGMQKLVFKGMSSLANR